MKIISTTYKGFFKNRYGVRADITVEYGPAGKVKQIRVEDVMSITSASDLDQTIRALQELQAAVEWEPPKSRKKKGVRTGGKAPVHTGYTAVDILNDL